MTRDMIKTNDSLRALMGGMGDPTRDKAAGLYYDYQFFTDFDLMNAYSGSWIARKIVNIPAQDMVREWRDWKGQPDQIEAIEAEETRLNVRQKVEEAQIRARLMGGAVIYISDGTNPASEFKPERVRKNGIKFLSVFSRVECQAGELEQDPMKENFQKPAYYTVRNVRIHPSRLVVFLGDASPEPLYNFGVNYGWGNSVLVAPWRAVTNLDGAYANSASLIFEANVDVIQLPEMLDQMNDKDYVKRLLDRMLLAAMNKGVNKSLLLDKEETYTRNPYSFAGIPDMIDKFVQAVCGAADIPATRFMGMSPAGLSSTGESDLKNYYDMIKAHQTLKVTPAMTRLDEALIWSSLGARDASIWYDWASLWQMTEKEMAEVLDKKATAAEKLVRTGLISQPALAAAVVNDLVESGIYPGLEQDVEENPIDWDAELEHQEALKAKELEPPPVPGGGKAFAKDATPRSLYISRKVLNASAILKWAKSQGLADLMPGTELHVTIAHSHAAVDWFKVGQAWESEMKLAAGGPRMVEQFDGGAIVIMFASNELQWRHRQVIDAGGSHDFPEYQPHITVSYSDTPIDLTAIEAYQGEIVLGPEIFESIKERQP